MTLRDAARLGKFELAQAPAATPLPHQRAKTGCHPGARIFVERIHPIILLDVHHYNVGRTLFGVFAAIQRNGYDGIAGIIAANDGERQVHQFFQLFLELYLFPFVFIGF